MKGKSKRTNEWKERKKRREEGRYEGQENSM